MCSRKDSKSDVDIVDPIRKQEFEDIIGSYGYYDLLPIDKKFKKILVEYFFLNRFRFNWKARFNRYCNKCRKREKCGYAKLSLDLRYDMQEIHDSDRDRYAKLHKVFGYCLVKRINCITQRRYLQENLNYECFRIAPNIKSTTKKTQKDFNKKIDQWFSIEEA